MFFICAIISTVLAVVDFNKEGRKKTVSIWEIIFDWRGLVLAILEARVFEGIYLFIKTK